MYTVTVQAADFAAAGTPPRSAYARVARAVPDVSGTTVVTAAAQTVRLTSGVGTFTAEEGVAYQIQLIGVVGVEEPWYFAHDTDCSAAELFRSYQVDPVTLAPLPTYPTVAAAIAAVQAAVNSLQAQVTGVVVGAPTLLDTLAELATAIGNDPNYSADVAAQIAALTNQVAGITLASLGGLSQSQVDARVGALADLKGAAAAITLSGLGGITPAAVDAKISQQAASDQATYVALAQIPVALDTDGVPYFANGSNFTGAVPLKTDTDGVPYLAA